MKNTLVFLLMGAVCMASCSNASDSPADPEVTVNEPQPGAHYALMDSVFYDISVLHVRPIDSVSLTIKRVSPDSTVLVFPYTPPSPVADLQLLGYWQNDLAGTNIAMISIFYIHDIENHEFRDTTYFTCN